MNREALRELAEDIPSIWKRSDGIWSNSFVPIDEDLVYEHSARHHSRPLWVRRNGMWDLY